MKAPKNLLQGIKVTAFAVAAIVAMAGTATAAPVTWEVMNHPDGNFQSPGGQYMMILSSEACDKCTFGVAGGGVFMSYDVSTNTHLATMTGTVQHLATNGVAEANGGLYTISATFEMGNCSPCSTDNLTDGGPNAPGDPWWGSNVANGTSGLYENAFADLLANSNTPFSGGGAAASSSYSEEVDRIYFDWSDLTLTHQSGAMSYSGPMVWDEAPDGGPKQFFIQEGWRGASGLAAAGWLNAPNQGDKNKFNGPSDFLFALNPFSGPGPGIPEPATTLLFALGMAGLGVTRRRKIERS